MELHSRREFKCAAHSKHTGSEVPGISDIGIREV